MINHLFHAKKTLLLIPVCVVLFALVQCSRNPAEQFKSKGGLKLWVKLDTSANDNIEARDQTIKIINDRIEYYGIKPNIYWSDIDNCAIVEVPGEKKPENIKHLLLSNANLEFWETYRLDELYPFLYDANSELTTIFSSMESESDSDTPNSIEDLLESIVNGEPEYFNLENNYNNQHPLFSKLSVNTIYMNTSLIGYAYQDDLDLVMGYLNIPQIRDTFPRDVIFKWSAKPVDDREMYELYAVKISNRDGSAAMSGDIILKAKRVLDDWGRDVISIQMNEVAGRQWERLTADNVGNTIAIVMDGKVYSAPMVMDKITGGSSWITGNFTREEANNLANLLNSGSMFYPIEIVKEEIVIP